MTLTKRRIWAGSVLLTLVMVVGTDLCLVRPGARRDVVFGRQAEAAASMNLRVRSCG